jgi:hypothetical protein
VVGRANAYRDPIRVDVSHARVWVRKVRVGATAVFITGMVLCGVAIVSLLAFAVWLSNQRIVFGYY